VDRRLRTGGGLRAAGGEGRSHAAPAPRRAPPVTRPSPRIGAQPAGNRPRRLVPSSIRCA
jgi:hypothetical protein